MYMLDTNICIYIINKKSLNVLEQLNKNLGKGLYISAITLAELECGLENSLIENSLYKEKNRIALVEFLIIMNIVYFDDNAAREFGIIKKSSIDRNDFVGLYNMLIGAHAKSLNMTLVTNNLSEFERIEGLKLENWV